MKKTKRPSPASPSNRGTSLSLPDFGEFNESTDLAALLRDDAEGRLHWGNSYKGHVEGSFLLELVRAEASFLPKVLATLQELIRDPSPSVRAAALGTMGPITHASNVKALAEALAASPNLYVGVKTLTGDPRWTLFSGWLAALGGNYPYDWPEARRAIKIADPYLELPEATGQGLNLKLTLLQEELVAALPGWLEGASDERMEKFADYLEPAYLETAGTKMRGATPATRERFARIARDLLARRFPQSGAVFWAQLAAALGVSPEPPEGLRSPPA
jgi:hypothetical protein